MSYFGGRQRQENIPAYMFVCLGISESTDRLDMEKVETNNWFIVSFLVPRHKSVIEDGIKIYVMLHIT